MTGDREQGSKSMRVRPSAALRPRAYFVPLALRLRLERLLEVFGVNTRLSSLRPSHRRSLCSVHLSELGLGRASGKSEESSALGNLSASSLGSHLRLFCGFLLLLSFLRFHFLFPSWNGFPHFILSLVLRHRPIFDVSDFPMLLGFRFSTDRTIDSIRVRFYHLLWDF